MRPSNEVSECSNTNHESSSLLTEESMPSFTFIKQNVTLWSKSLFSKDLGFTYSNNFTQIAKKDKTVGSKNLLGKNKNKSDPFEFDFENVYAPVEYDKEYKLCFDICS